MKDQAMHLTTELFMGIESIESLLLILLVTTVSIWASDKVHSVIGKALWNIGVVTMIVLTTMTLLGIAHVESLLEATGLALYAVILPLVLLFVIGLVIESEFGGVMIKNCDLEQ